MGPQQDITAKKRGGSTPKDTDLDGSTRRGGRRAKTPAQSSYYHRNRERRLAYQNTYNTLHRPAGSRKKTKQSSPAHNLVFFRFGMDTSRVSLTTSGFQPVYFNEWAHPDSKDKDRTEDVLYAETDLALCLHYLQLEESRKAEDGEWVSEYIEELGKLAEEELKAANRLRRRSLDLGNPPRFLVRLHQHRRHLAIIMQEIDLVEQAVRDDATGGDIGDPFLYLKHVIQTGSAIITGARVNEKRFEREYGF